MYSKPTSVPEKEMSSTTRNKSMINSINTSPNLNRPSVLANGFGVASRIRMRACFVVSKVGIVIGASEGPLDPVGRYIVGDTVSGCLCERESDPATTTGLSSLCTARLCTVPLSSREMVRYFHISRRNVDGGLGSG